MIKTRQVFRSLFWAVPLLLVLTTTWPVHAEGESLHGKQDDCRATPTVTSIEPTPAAEAKSVKELNLVLLHGMGGHDCDLQRLSDHIIKLLPAYVSEYRQSNPDIAIRLNTLSRCYPAYVDIEDWAKNFADDINEHFGDKGDLILVGHSMGGKSALYAVANNVGNLADKAAMVVTINSPVRSMNTMFSSMGTLSADYLQRVTLGRDEGVSDSLVNYDSSKDGLKVASTKSWLAFVSSEEAPLSDKFDIGGVDLWPTTMDDGIVPLTAQFSEGADVVYYGTYGHSDFADQEAPANYIADQLLRYIFGYPVGCAVIAGTGTVEHKADWLLGTDFWDDVAGGVLAGRGNLKHKNESFFEWQEWEDKVTGSSEIGQRSYAHMQLSSPPILTGIEESRWAVTDEPQDYSVYVRTRAAPRATVEVNWAIYTKPSEVQRSFYNLEIIDSTPLAGIRYASWMEDDPRQFRLWIWSEAQSPFRWLRGRWDIYVTEMRQKKVIDQIGAKGLAN